MPSHITRLLGECGGAGSLRMELGPSSSELSSGPVPAHPTSSSQGPQPGAWQLGTSPTECSSKLSGTPLGCDQPQRELWELSVSERPGASPVRAPSAHGLCDHPAPSPRARQGLVMLLEQGYPRGLVRGTSPPCRAALGPSQHSPHSSSPPGHRCVQRGEGERHGPVPAALGG